MYAGFYLIERWQKSHNLTINRFIKASFLYIYLVILLNYLQHYLQLLAEVLLVRAT